MTQENFFLRHINRLKFPTKNVIVCEDDLHHQYEIASKLNNSFERQGNVQFNFVPSGLVAASILVNIKTSLVLLDHDMPVGNGTDLIEWISANKKEVPIITFSDIDQNNINMEALCKNRGIEVHKFSKFDVISGSADDLIKEILSREG